MPGLSAMETVNSTVSPAFTEPEDMETVGVPAAMTGKMRLPTVSTTSKNASILFFTTPLLSENGRTDPFVLIMIRV